MSYSKTDVNANKETDANNKHNKDTQSNDDICKILVEGVTKTCYEANNEKSNNDINIVNVAKNL